MPRLCIAAVDHASVLVASDAEHYVGVGPLAPFANVPSEHHHQASVITLPHTIVVLVHALPRPWASRGLRATSTSTRNATWLILLVVICLS